MSDNTQNPVKIASLAELRNVREQFVKTQAAAQQQLSDIDKQIAEAARVEADAQREAALKQIIPGNDKAVLKGHDILFMINNTKEAGRGPDSLLGAAVAAAYKAHSLVVSAGVDDASVAAKFWGGAATSILKLNSKFGDKAYDGTPASARNFLAVAKEIMATNTPDQVTDRQKNYIIICDGAIAGDVAHSSAILESAAKFNPKATFDFVVCNAAATSIDALVQNWGVTASGQKPNLVKVGTPAEVTGAVLNIIKARLAGSVHTQPTPAAKTSPPSSSPSL